MARVQGSQISLVYYLKIIFISQLKENLSLRTILSLVNQSQNKAVANKVCLYKYFLMRLKTNQSLIHMMFCYTSDPPGLAATAQIGHPLNFVDSKVLCILFFI